jgi:ribosomal protein L7/L12
VHCRLSDRTARTLLASTHLSSLARLDLTGTNASAAAKQRAARLSWRTRPFYPRSIEEPLMLEGNRIASIKEYRGVAETGLANAKMAVERIWEEIVEPPNCVGAVPRWVR